MDIIREIAKIIEKSEREFENTRNRNNYKFNKETILSEKFTDDDRYNKFYISDNIHAMKDLLDRGYKSNLDLIYIDPPFFTRANYNHRVEVLNNGKKHAIKIFAYKDKWEDGFLEYLEMITIRLFFLKELLSERGTVYVHLDSNAVHYVKIIMDYIFGRNRFLNEIIWSYKSGGTGRKSFSKKHDNILAYTKTDKYIFNPQKEKSYNRGLKPYRFKGVKEYEDHMGWYTLVNLKDVWQIDMVGRTSSERVGYATQKPEKLLERLILSSTDEMSIVGDFFAGSGTTAAVAEKLGRKWIVTDKGHISESVIRRRLLAIETNKYEILSEKEPLDDKGKLNMEVDYNKENNLLKFEFKSYNIDLKKINIDDKDKNIIKSILKDNSLNLIEYIGIGYKDKEGVFIIFKEIMRDSKTLIIEKRISIENPIKNNEDLYLNFIDIFGNKIQKKIFPE